MALKRSGVSRFGERIIVLDDAETILLTCHWSEALSSSTVIVTANWDVVLEEAIEAAAGRDPLGDLLRILREHAPDVASAKNLLPRTRAEALQMIAILISLMSLWIATHQGDQHLSAQDEMRLAHAMGMELRSTAHKRADALVGASHR
jgi:hypothetical protein